MKLISHYVLVFVMTGLLLGCLESVVKKEDVKHDPVKAKAEIVDLVNEFPRDNTGLGSSTDKNIKIPPRSIVEIAGKQQGIKFKDDYWADFSISINLNVVPLRAFFNMIGQLANINFVVGDEVTGDITLNLKNVDWFETFQMVLKEKNLMHDVNSSGNVITVHAHKWIEEQSASFNTALASKLKALKSLTSLESKTTAIFKLNYTKPNVLAKQLADVIALLEGGEGSTVSNRASFVVDKRTNSIIVQATPTDMTWIKSTIETLDKATKQVMVEVFIVEATDNFQTELGSRVGLFRTARQRIAQATPTIAGTLGGTAPTAAGTITTATTVGSVASNAIGSAKGALAMVFSGGASDLRLELQAMQSESLIKIISNPKLFIIDNEEATITDGVEVPYSTVAQAGATATTEFKNASLQLKVTPHIIDDGNIYLDIVVNKDTPLTGSPPPISTKKLQTKLLIRDGGVALIGGITKNERQTANDGVPFLKDLPGIGHFFESKSDKNNLNTLYIFIAPVVI